MSAVVLCRAAQGYRVLTDNMPANTNKYFIRLRIAQLFRRAVNSFVTLLSSSISCSLAYSVFRSEAKVLLGCAISHVCIFFPAGGKNA